MSQAALNTRNSEEEVSSRRNNGTRLAGILFLLTVLTTVLVSGWVVLGWMEDAQRLPLSKLVLTGERHYTRNDDIRQSILALGEPGTFMTQDVNIIQTQIEQRLPWIKQVSVRKQWPDELKIHLVEYVPIARWNDQHMVDAEGNTFSVPPDRTSKQVLPMLYGPEGSANEVLQGYREMGQMLAKDRFTLKEAAPTALWWWPPTTPPPCGTPSAPSWSWTVWDGATFIWWWAGWRRSCCEAFTPPSTTPWTQRVCRCWAWYRRTGTSPMP